MANLPDMKITKNVTLAILALASGSAFSADVKNSDGNVIAQTLESNFPAPRDPLKTPGIVLKDDPNAPKFLTIGDAKPFSGLSVLATSDDIEMKCDGKVFFVLNGLAVDKPKPGETPWQWPKFMPPAKAEQVTITLTTADGKQWRAKWEEVAAK